MNRILAIAWLPASPGLEYPPSDCHSAGPARGGAGRVEGVFMNHFEVEEGPGRWYYGLGGAVLVAGCVYFGVFLWQNISRIGENLTQVLAPGKSQLTLAKPGKYTIFYEHQSVVGNKVYSTSEELSGLECSLVSMSTDD